MSESKSERVTAAELDEIERLDREYRSRGLQDEDIRRMEQWGKKLLPRMAAELRAYRAPVDVAVTLRSVAQQIEAIFFEAPQITAEMIEERVRPHVERAAVLAREAEGLRARASLATQREAEGEARIGALVGELGVARAEEAASARATAAMQATLLAVGFPRQDGEPLTDTFARAWAYCVDMAHKRGEALDGARAETERIRQAARDLRDQADACEDARSLHDAINEFCAKVLP